MPETLPALTPLTRTLTLTPPSHPFLPHSLFLCMWTLHVFVVASFILCSAVRELVLLCGLTGFVFFFWAD